ncbi:MAG: hypothetical protein V4662_22580 [Verrucomicrobiota bacterium]
MDNNAKVREEALGWSKLKVAIMTFLILAAYVLSYRVCVILGYFNYISSERGIGRVLEVLFIPLGYLEQNNETIQKFFSWLTEIIASPFF